MPYDLRIRAGFISVVVGLLLWALSAAADTQPAPGEAHSASTTHETSNQAEKKSYSFGVVPQFEQRKLVHIWRPVLDELERRTGLSFVLVGSARIPTFEKDFIDGDFDFAYINPYHLLKGRESQGYVPLVRDGGRLLRGIIVVRRDSTITSVRELEGEEVAFPATNALGASLLVRAELERMHHVRVEPRYVQTHSSVYLHVAKNLVVAGCGVLSTLQLQPQAVQDSLRVLYTTAGVPPHAIAAHPRVPDADRKRVQEALLAMAADRDGQALLAGIPIKQAIPATMMDYQAVDTLGLDEFYIPEP